MDSIEQHIDKNKEILSDPTTSPQQRRHLESELADLEEYAITHPDDHTDPSPLELFCSKNPDAAECRVYED